LTRKDWLLLALAHREGKPLSPAQVQKTMFLLGEEAKGHIGSGFYKFIPYNYGPFCREIYDDIDRLSFENLVTTVAADNRRVFLATPAGLTQGKILAREADAAALAYLKKAVDWAASKSFPDLVRAIYVKYPKYRVNSVFVD
jgi:hypothetical protein